MEDRIREVCAQLLDAQSGRDSFDYVQDFGARVPSMVISSLIGVPPSDQEQVRHIIDRTFHLDPEHGMVNEFSLKARIELHEYLLERLDERASEPQDDMLTALLEAEITDDEGVQRHLEQQPAVADGVSAHLFTPTGHLLNGGPSGYGGTEPEEPPFQCTTQVGEIG